MTWLSGAAILGGAAAAAALASAWGGHRWMRAAFNATGHRSEALSLYRQILRAAEDWPSRKKTAVVSEIRQAFRTNAAEKDAQAIEQMLAEARSGLKELLHSVAQGARLRATPSAPKGLPREERRAWHDGSAVDAGVEAQSRAERWALDELGVGASPTMSEAKLAYHEKAKACHPDSGTPSADAEAFKRLQKAWEHVRMHLLRSQQLGRRFR